MTSPFPCCPVNRKCHVKENLDRKKILSLSILYMSVFSVSLSFTHASASMVISRIFTSFLVLSIITIL